MNVAIVGGGLAGLSAACELADLGHTVTIFERRPWCGGKTYSHEDDETGEEVDNGQHIYMACTTAYIDFLRKIGTAGLVKRQKRLRVRVFDAAGRLSELRASALPPPLHLGWSFFRYRHLGLRAKARIARALVAATALTEAERLALHSVTLGHWLRELGQDDGTIRAFWDFMLIPTINARADDSSAADALFVLRHGFLHSNTNAAIGVSTVGLSKLQVDPAIHYIEARGGTVRTGTTVDQIAVEDGRAVGVRVAGALEPFDGVVCALPAKQSLQVLPPDLEQGGILDALAAVETAPIVNLHCWFDRRVAGYPFAAYVGNELQWVFNRGLLDREPQRAQHRIVISLSAAQPYMQLTKRELEERFMPQIRAAVPGAAEASLLRFAAIKEPEATFVPAPGLRRVDAVTSVPGLVLAGAHTNTGWPATMESAIRSGRSASEALAVHFSAVEPSLHRRQEVSAWESP